MTRRAIVLAAGLGRRMRVVDLGAVLTLRQAEMARAGLKALIPVDRPFIEYVLSALVEAGIREVCVVIGRATEAIREHLTRLNYSLLRIEFARQESARGTADALLAAASFAMKGPFLLINSDNYYPPAALRLLVGLSEPGLVAFERLRSRLTAGDRAAGEGVDRYAVIERDDEGYLTRIIEKPDPETCRSLPEPILVSMNCWCLPPAILAACAAIGPSVRGEFELPSAIEHAIAHQNLRFRVQQSSELVIDLSVQGDIPAAVRLLRLQEIVL